jgi:murein DD-endopeptidase MepM/ murein hydrolase activator NlpD
MRSPVKKEFVTQAFGVNPSRYAQWGLKGHSGIDYRAFLPNGERCYEGGKSEVFAPHNGKILEYALDANGYGNYIKIENDNEGSVLGHFHTHSPH